MPDESTLAEVDTCQGHAAVGECGAPVRYEVSRQAGQNTVKTMYACGRHLSWLIAHMTVPGRSVVVTRRS